MRPERGLPAGGESDRPCQKQNQDNSPGWDRGRARDRTSGLEESIVSVYITGDTHGGFQRFEMKYFPEQKKRSREDTVIIAGDFGGLWGGTPAEKYWLDWLEDKPFTTAFLDGNHENFAMLNVLPERRWRGGRVHEVRPRVLHLMRGQVFDIGGYTFFTMGGRPPTTFRTASWIRRNRASRNGTGGCAEAVPGSGLKGYPGSRRNSPPMRSMRRPEKT